MTRHYLIYLLPAICLLSACQSEYDEPGLAEAGSGEALEIMVAETVNTVSGSGASRSYEAGASTEFENGDRIGIIILGEDGKILADNVPYVYDGEKWDFHADNADGKSRIYYDATMYKYIAYYPYTAQADVKIEGNAEKTQEKIDSLMQENIDGYFKGLPMFKWREDQSSEENFRCSDPMVWSETGYTPSRRIKVKLGHIRNCFVLDPKVEWELANGDVINYQPRNYQIELTYGTHDVIIPNDSTAISDTGFDDLYIYLGDSGHREYLKKYEGVDSTRIDIIFRAQDGSYRYILGDEKEYTFNWEYTYRNGKTYGGIQTIRPDETRNTRFIHDETLNMGNLMDDNVKVGDFFCCKDGVGYPLPYDAVDLLDRNLCVGVVFYVGHYSGTDHSDYSETAIGSEKCHGYVMALTEASNETLKWSNTIYGHLTGDAGYSGYWYRQRILSEATTDVTIANFPAFYACDLYGTKDWHRTLTPPVKNTSGWYLPTKSQASDIRNTMNNVVMKTKKSFTFKDKESLMKTLATVRCKLPRDCEYLEYILPNRSLGWWTSSQDNGNNPYYVTLAGGTGDQSSATHLPTYEHHVRAVLSY